ncbi:MAG: hypothetical protein KKH75_11030 [Actinobacteria bacterium]|nr:hypothetical protein [Actinomycetota bacterium]
MTLPVTLTSSPSARRAAERTGCLQGEVVRSTRRRALDARWNDQPRE